MRKTRLFLCLAALFMSICASFAQDIRVSGTITDVSNEPVIDAAVQLKGNLSVYAMSDAFGAYAISVPKDGVLMVTCLGYRTIEIPVNGKTKLDIVLSLETENLDEVIVTAQGLTRKEKSIGYAQTQLDGEELNSTRQNDLGNALAGRIAGARFFGASGATFDEGSIVLRGSTDYTSPTGSEPIYVVDGTITSKSAVNMDDVENVSVLKGAAATALYGSNGANGAVVITTKKPMDGKGSVDFSHTFTVESYYNHFNMQHQYGGGSIGEYGAKIGNSAESLAASGYEGYDLMSADFLYGVYKGWVNADGSYYIDFRSDESWGARFDKNVKVATSLYYDPTSSQYQQAQPWVGNLELADLFQTGFNNTTNISFSKSGKDYSARVSFTNTQRTGIQQNSDATRRYLTAKLVFSPKKWVDVSLDWKYTYRRNHNAAVEGYGGTGNVFYTYIQWAHTEVDLKDYKDYLRPDGTWRNWDIASITNLKSSWTDNPFAVMDKRNAYRTSHYNVITGDVQFNLPYNIKAGFRTMANMNSSINETTLASMAYHWTPSYSQNQSVSSDITLQGRLTYGGHFIDNRLSVDAAAFIEERSYDYRYLNAATASGLTIDNFFNLSNSSSYVTANNTLTQYKLRSMYGNATVGFDDTYFIDASVRNDWDSRLPKTNNSYLYGGLSASVMLDNILPESDWLDYWKVRGSLAQVGSTLSAYDVSPVFYTDTKYNTTLTMREDNVQLNQAIQPTISTSYEVGTAFRLFGNRIVGDINLYTRDTRNQILEAPVLYVTGYSRQQKNAGLINNKGIEIELGVTPIKTANFQWDIDVNFAKNISCLEYLDDNTDFYQISGSKFYYYAYNKAIVGRPLGVITTTSRWARDDQGRLLLERTDEDYFGGGYKYVLDLTEQEVGTMQPDFTGGFSTSMRYKGFTLGLNFDYSKGGYVWSLTNSYGETSGTSMETVKLNNNGVCVREPIMNGGGVNIEGVDAETGQPVSCYMNAYAYYHEKGAYDMDSFIYSRSYIKLRNVSLSYKVPGKWLKQHTPFVSNASISVNANNPWLVYSAAPNFDPSESSTNWREGGQAAATRSFGFTLKLGF